MTVAIGVAISLVLFGLLVVGLWWTWRSPFVGLGLLVAGMAFHSFLLMVLLRLGTPTLLVRVFQGWKEILLVFLTGVAVWRLYQQRHARTVNSLIAMDWIAIGLAVLAVAYFLIPSSILHSDANFSQRLVGVRVIFLIPLLYFLGRSFSTSDDRNVLTVIWLSLGVAGVVTLFGVFELFFVPTREWLNWGVNQYTSFLGFKYQGPAGLPENFFLSLPDGTFVRRMVSTYISPLGIAYTAILLFPMGVAVTDRRVPTATARWIAILTAMIVLGVALAITRLALFCLIGEAVVLWVMLRRAWTLALVPGLILVTILALYPYTSIGPTVDKNLNPIHRTGFVWAIAGHDSSANEHYTYLIADLKFDLQHPLGLGTGASTIRYGKLVGTGESAVLGMFGDLGLLGGALYLALYVLTIWNGWRILRAAKTPSLHDVMPVVAVVGGLGLFPITMTSDLWGDLSVTFLFWWVAGATATMATRAAEPARRRVLSASPAPV